MKSKHPIRLLLILTFSAICIAAGCFIQRGMAPAYQVKKAVHNTFSSLNDTALSPYWTTPSLSPAYQQNLVLAIKDSSTGNPDVILNNLHGVQLSLSAKTDTTSAVSHGNYTMAYSAIPLVRGDFLLSNESVCLTAPGLFDGSIAFSSRNAISSLRQSALEEFFPEGYDSIDMNIINIPAFAMQLQPEFHQFYEGFYANDFHKISRNTTVKGESFDYKCSVYQLNLSQTSSTSLENILSIINNSPVGDLLASSFAEHPELQPLTDYTCMKNATIHLAIDSKNTVRQVQCKLSSAGCTYDYTLTLTGKDAALSSYVLALVCTDNKTQTVTSYCQLQKKEPHAYSCYAQSSDSSAVDYFTFAIRQENGVIHEASKLDYEYHTFDSPAPVLQDILYGIHGKSTTRNDNLICKGTLKYYVSTHSEESCWELNMESFTIQLPDYDTSLTISVRYTQQATDNSKD